MVKEEHHECCMCGDEGVSTELFTCKNCRFRLQHKYCSNLYPGAETYNICNWCLTQQKDDQKAGERAIPIPIPIPSPKSSHKITTVHQDGDSIKMIKKKRVLLGDDQGDGRTSNKKPSKLPVEVEVDHRAAAGRRRVDAGGGGRINIRRTRSEEMSSNGGNGMIIKQVFRNKVRRYKLLDDVSS